MNWADKRKLLYLSGLIIFLAIVVGIPAYLLWYQEPTCFDNKQNQSEQGIDCGGPCVKLCRATELDPVVEWQQVFRVADGVYTAVAYIQNPNIQAEAINVPYTFIFYGADNKLITTKTGKAYLPAGKNFAIIETGIVLRGQVPTRTLFEFGNDFSWRVANKNKAMPIIQSQALSDAAKSPTLNAVIANPTFTDIKTIDIVAIIYDKQGNAFAASRTVVDNLDSQTTQHIIFTWPEPFTKPVSRIEIIPIPR